jgi:hypothetical protein
MLVKSVSQVRQNKIIYHPIVENTIDRGGYVK